jgi:hypothetical protein
MLVEKLTTPSNRMKKKETNDIFICFFFFNFQINQLDDLFNNNNYSQTGKHGGTHGLGL